MLTQRAAAAASPMPSAVMGHFEEQPDDPSRLRALTAAGPVPFAEYLAGFDIIVKCIRQDCHDYAVDHSPSHLWNSATWEISEALLPYLRKVMSGPAA
ncbi:hypothetical protein [Streptomyces fagopyri]|uniref:hypothetical protein n=1 Tax=Streptomyces fagopyri TaxID=2662397 RepID=UPI00340E7AE0